VSDIVGSSDADEETSQVEGEDFLAGKVAVDPNTYNVCISCD
jgi:hypothetical protein